MRRLARVSGEYRLIAGIDGPIAFSNPADRRTGNLGGEGAQAADRHALG